MKTKPIPFRLSEEDLKKLEQVRKFYGMITNAETIRMLIHKAAREVSNENFKK